MSEFLLPPVVPVLSALPASAPDGSLVQVPESPPVGTGLTPPQKVLWVRDQGQWRAIPTTGVGPHSHLDYAHADHTHSNPHGTVTKVTGVVPAAGGSRIIAQTRNASGGSNAQRAMAKVTIWNEASGSHQFAQFVVGVAYNRPISSSFAWLASGTYSAMPLRSISLRTGSTYDRSYIVAVFDPTGADITWNILVEDLKPFEPGFEAILSVDDGVQITPDLTRPVPPALNVWQTPSLATGWTNYSSSYGDAAYMMDSSGMVHLRGLVKGGTGTIFTLPQAYRPVHRLMFAVVGANSFGRLDVSSSGDVIFQSGTATYVSLDTAKFTAGY